MKRLLSFLSILIICSCSNKEVKKEPFPFIEVKENEWAVYEGKILTEDGFDTEVELSLKENTVGVDSDYKLIGVAISDRERFFNYSQGKFSVAYGLADQAIGVELKGTSTGKLVSATVISHAKFPKRISFESRNVYFKTNGSEQLVFSDNNYNPVAEDNRYTLYKRSDLFTAEGYLTVIDTGEADFFERNTSGKWKVSPLGVYPKIDSMYKKLAKVYMEGIYLRALAYSVADTTADGEPTRKLVIKRVIEMNASH